MSISIDQVHKNASLKSRDKVKTERTVSLFKKDFNFGKAFNDKKKEQFYGEVGMLLKSGIDIKTCLEIAVEEQEKDKHKVLLKNIQEDVIKGSSFSEAIKQSEVFSDYEYYSIKIGEESSRLSEVLQNLSEYFAKKIEQRRKLISTLSYPVLVLGMAILAVYFMLSFIVPMFEEVFKRFNGDLPALTKVIIHLSEWTSDYAVLILIISIVIFSSLYVQRKKDWFRRIHSKIILSMPFVGDITEKIYMARFCHSMNFLISAKNPLLNSLELVRKMIGFYPYETALKNVEKEVLKGESLSSSLSEYAFISKKMIYLIKVAEEVNQLETIFMQLSKQYQDEVNYKMNTLSGLLEPIMILFIGSFVAIILIAMYLPLFQLSTSIF